MSPSRMPSSHVNDPPEAAGVSTAVLCQCFRQNRREISLFVVEDIPDDVWSRNLYEVLYILVYIGITCRFQATGHDERRKCSKYMQQGRPTSICREARLALRLSHRERNSQRGHIFGVCGGLAQSVRAVRSFSKFLLEHLEAVGANTNQLLFDDIRSVKFIFAMMCRLTHRP